MKGQRDETQQTLVFYAIVTVLAWGVWGALIDAPARANFPETLGYVVWALTMILPAMVALSVIGWRLDHADYLLSL